MSPLKVLIQNSRHNLKKFHRKIIAGLLTGIYLAISLSSLASLTLGSASIAHAITGECSGNCEIDGCSAERKASHTCCCCIKKMKELENKKGQGTCCNKKNAQHAKTIMTCNCPCGKGKQLVLFNSEKFEQLPYQFTRAKHFPLEGQLSFNIQPRMTTHYYEPFTPPPERPLFS